MVKRYVAEGIGTFFVVFAPVAATFSSLGLLEMALASGLAVMAMVYVFGPVSAAHFNPAVTLGFAAAKRFAWKFVPGYVGSQLTGAIVAACMAALLFKPGLGTHFPAEDLAGRNFGIEFLITFMLMTVIMAVATDRRVSNAIPGVAIGLTVVAGVLVGGPVTGGSMNPARSLGPALFGGGNALSHLWLYIIGPVSGAVCAAIVFENLRPDPSNAVDAPALD